MVWGWSGGGLGVVWKVVWKVDWHSSGLGEWLLINGGSVIHRKLYIY